jgi:hypothetical protein
MLILIFGVIRLVLAPGLDPFFRQRMANYKWALLQRGAFDYTNDHRERTNHGWAAWPVCLMWTMTIFGIAFLMGGFFLYFGPATPLAFPQPRISPNRPARLHY